MVGERRQVVVSDNLTSAVRKPLINSPSSQLTSKSCPSSSSGSFRRILSIQYELVFCASQVGALPRNLLILPYILCNGSAIIAPISAPTSATMEATLVSRALLWTVLQTSH